MPNGSASAPGRTLVSITGLPPGPSTSPPAISNASKPAASCSSSNSDKMKVGVGVNLEVRAPLIAAAGASIFGLPMKKRKDPQQQQQHSGRRELKYEVEVDIIVYQTYSGHLAEMPPRSEIGKIQGTAGVGKWLSGTISVERSERKNDGRIRCQCWRTRFQESQIRMSSTSPKDGHGPERRYSSMRLQYIGH